MIFVYHIACLKYICKTKFKIKNINVKNKIKTRIKDVLIIAHLVPLKVLGAFGNAVANIRTYLVGVSISITRYIPPQLYFLEIEP